MLPKLTEQQNKFVLEYGSNGCRAIEAYKKAYDCSKMNNNSIYVEASRLLKNPKISPWIEYIEQNAQRVAVDELNYSIKDCFLELDQLKNLSLETRNTFSVAKGCIELKGKLAGHFKEKQEVGNLGLASLLDKLD